jgi:N-acetylmuramoyl-L-alanine amidase
VQEGCLQGFLQWRNPRAATVLRLLVKLLALAALSIFGLVLAGAGPATARAPVDFEIAGHAGARASANGAVESSRIRTPREFNLVGMRWRGRAEPRIALRVRSQSRWSRWVKLAAHADHNPDPLRGEPLSAASDPIWVGRADAVQYRMSRRVPGLRLHFVDVGRRPRLRPARHRARGAAAPPFPYVTRAEWGASACPPRAAPSYGSVEAIHVHHTVSLNDYTPEEGPAIVLAICRFHRNSNGWDDIGYQMLVDKYGTLYEGRAGGLDKAVIGAQAQGFNAQTAGISNIGDFSNVPETAEALNAIATYIRWKLPVHGQPLSGLVTLTSAGGSLTKYPAGTAVRLQRVIGHRDTGRTACPGTALYAQLDGLRDLVESGTPLTSAPVAQVSATVADARIDYGESTPVAGTLVSPEGTPLPGETVELQVNNTGRWRVVRRLTTDAGGGFAHELKLRRRSYVRVRWRGNALLTGAFSARLLVRVRPIVTLDAPLTLSKKGRRVAVTGTVTPRKRFVQLVLQQQIRGRYRRVGVRSLRTRRGVFEGSFTPAFAGRYRYFVVARPDLNTDRGRSPVIGLTSGR